jgi:hypothetical protein
LRELQAGFGQFAMPAADYPQLCRNNAFERA